MADLCERVEGSLKRRFEKVLKSAEPGGNPFYLIAAFLDPSQAWYLTEEQKRPALSLLENMVCAFNNYEIFPCLRFF